MACTLTQHLPLFRRATDDQRARTSMSSCSWKRVTMRCPSLRTGALKQQGTACVSILHMRAHAQGQRQLPHVHASASLPNDPWLCMCAGCSTTRRALCISLWITAFNCSSRQICPLQACMVQYRPALSLHHSGHACGAHKGPGSAQEGAPQQRTGVPDCAQKCPAAHRGGSRSALGVVIVAQVHAHEPEAKRRILNRRELQLELGIDLQQHLAHVPA